jgi:hypothetical protein
MQRTDRCDPLEPPRNHRGERRLTPSHLRPLLLRDGRRRPAPPARRLRGPEAGGACRAGGGHTQGHGCLSQRAHP